MERTGTQIQYAALGCKRCAMLLLPNEKGQEEWRIYSNPTIGEIQSLRRKGALILRQVVERHGNQVDRTWITDNGLPVIVSTDFLTCNCEKET
jgi:hypothetical protein